MDRGAPVPQGGPFSCLCGNDRFFQEAMARTREIVQLAQGTAGVSVTALEMEEVTPDNIEYNSDFTCTKCGETYRVLRKDGREMIA